VDTPDNPDIEPQVGWMGVNNDPRWYAEELIWADQNIYQDPIIEAVCVFTASPYYPWGSFEATEKVGELLAEYVRSNPPVEDAELPPAPAFISDITTQLPKHPTKKYGTRKLDDIDFAVLHHAVTPNADSIGSLLRTQRIADYHIRHWDWPGIGYHYVIDREGRIFQTNALTTVSNHAAGANLHGVGICLLGTYTKETPPQAQADAAARLAKQLGHPMFGHNHWGGTVCPGRAEAAVRAALAKL